MISNTLIFFLFGHAKAKSSIPIKCPFNVHIRTVQSTDDVSRASYSSEISRLQNAEKNNFTRKIITMEKNSALGNRFNFRGYLPIS